MFAHLEVRGFRMACCAHPAAQTVVVAEGEVSATPCKAFNVRLRVCFPQGRDVTQSGCSPDKLKVVIDGSIASQVTGILYQTI